MGEMRNAYIILVGKPERMRPLGKHKHRWECNIGMDLREARWEVVDRKHLAQDGNQWQVLVNTVTKLRVPQKAANFLNS
jgi:hypothetical protein